MKKPVVHRDDKYLAFIRGLTCCVCDRPGPNEAHHTSKRTGGMGMKGSDYRAVPYCAWHHLTRHNDGVETFEREYAIDEREIVISCLENYVAGGNE